MLLSIMAGLSFIFTMGYCNILAQTQPSTINIPPGASDPSAPMFFDPSVANFGLRDGSVTVRWMNQDNAYHTVTSLTGAFDSQMIPPSGFFDHTFYDTGYYDYSCTLHPYMTGAVKIS
jgi:nitrite reductase (NO-forming)